MKGIYNEENCADAVLTLSMLQAEHDRHSPINPQHHEDVFKRESLKIFQGKVGKLIMEVVAQKLLAALASGTYHP